MPLVCGLLHDLGKIALDAILPKSFARVVEAADMLRGNIADLEREHHRAGSHGGRQAVHRTLGSSLAQVRECVWLHGQLPESLPATVRHKRLVNLITLADLLVRSSTWDTAEITSFR